MHTVSCYNVGMKLLNGSELAGFIKERQAKEVRSLRQGNAVEPKLAIVSCGSHHANQVYMRMKKRYGEDIGVGVDIYNVEQPDLPDLLKRLAADQTVHGIIVQLPLDNPDETDTIVNMIPPSKDVDGLCDAAIYEPATPMAILWLLAGYNVDFKGKHIVLVGRGKLVGEPLERMLLSGGNTVTVVRSKTPNPDEVILSGDIVITATGKHGLITPEKLKQGAVVVDAGVAGEQGKTVGDLAESVYERDDLTLTPVKGGVGPLTICALFENVIRAARATTKV